MDVELAARLNELFVEHDETLESFGAIADKSPQAASKWLKTGNISKESLRALANHYNCNINWLIYEQGPKYRQTDQSVPPADLPQDEQALLSKYRGMSSEKKRTMQTVSSALAQQEIGRDAA